MSASVYVGNIPYKWDNTDLEMAFTGVGQIKRATIIMDKETGRSKGFGFVEFMSEELAQAAIRDMNGFQAEGRAIRVSEAKENRRD